MEEPGREPAVHGPPSQGTPHLATRRLSLSPLRVDDAASMVDVLSDRELYRYIGGAPPDRGELEARYAAQVAGGDGTEIWHNWIVRLADSGRAVGYVQATVVGAAADLAWLIGPAWQRRGYGVEAAVAMRDWLGSTGVRRFTAHIHAGHTASRRLAAAIGLRETGEVDDDGEIVWASSR